MLKSIRIRNFAIVEEISIDFSEGFNLITGETGAGKSLIVDALEILLGERSSSSFVRTGEKRATVEGAFDAEGAPEIEEIFTKAGIAFSDEIILKREIGMAGGGKIYINGEMASASSLKLIGGFLIDIHGQHQHQSLLNPQNHCALLDSFGENEKQLDEVSHAADLLMRSLKDFEKLQSQMNDREKKMDFLAFQVNEIERVSPIPGEDESLSREIEILKNAETLKTLVSEAYGSLYEDERSILYLMKHVRQNIEKLSGIDKEAAKLLAPLEDARFSLEDLSFYLRDYLKKLDCNPGRLAEISDRSAEIDRLKRKYGGTIEKILEVKERGKEDMERLKVSDEHCASLKEQLEKQYEQYRTAACSLSRKRHEDRKRFSKKVVEELSDIAMEKCRFAVHVETDPLPEYFMYEAGYSLGPTGIDRAEFLISMNVGEELRPLSKIASGGELSRIMLAINTVLKKTDTVKTLLFDEVDAGIGAGVASNVGQKLKALSRKNQVICITHLPQIASLADHHLKVIKEVAGERTVVHVEALEGKEKVREIARMLAGENISAASLKHAEEMIKNEKRGSFETKSSLPRNV